jgi:hypothetical protein
MSKFEISQRTLYNVKRALAAGRTILLWNRTVKYFLANTHVSQ